MIVYDGVKSDFLHSVEADTIALEIQQKILEKISAGGYVPSNKGEDKETEEQAD